jgi:hypothetical protein
MAPVFPSSSKAPSSLATATDEMKKKRRARRTVMKTIGDDEELMFVCVCGCVFYGQSHIRLLYSGDSDSKVKKEEAH